jgi:tripartite-type tricarboxylate transporter receptor subunit TctC
MGALALPSAPAWAAEWPNQPFRIVTSFSPGGGTDYLARQLAPRMAAVLGQPVIVENRAGGSGTIAATAVAKQLPADGYSILIGDRGIFALNPAMFESLPYDPLKDLVPVTLIALYDFVLVVNPQIMPVRTVADVIAAAKAAPSGLNYASPGNQTTHRLAMELFAREARLNLVPVPYKGGAPALQDLLAGQVGMMFLDRVSAAPYIASGKLRPIAVAGKARVAAYPDVPTMAESGVKDFDVDSWLAFAMRQGTPEAAVRAVREAFLKASADEELRQRLAGMGIALLSSSPEELRKHVRAEHDRWAIIVRERGLKPG